VPPICSGVGKFFSATLDQKSRADRLQLTAAFAEIREKVLWCGASVEKGA
jgi:hypothetical protein